MERPALADIEAARARLDGISRVTPVFASSTLERLAGRAVLLKAENLQLTGAFKIRGAFNTIAQLTGGRAAGGRRHGERGEPRPGGRLGGARGRDPRDDLRAGGRADGEGGGGPRVRRCRRARGRGLRRGGRGRTCVRGGSGATFVHAFDDPRIIAGQGTLGLELAEQLPAAPAPP